MEVEERGARELDNVVHRPCIAPTVKCWRKLKGVETGRDVRNHPEDKPQRSPWSAEQHGHVLRREPESSHTDPVAHPVYYEGASSVGIWILRGPDVRSGMAVHGHKERETDEGVDEREEEVASDGGNVAPDDQL